MCDVLESIPGWEIIRLNYKKAFYNIQLNYKWKLNRLVIIKLDNMIIK